MVWLEPSHRAYETTTNESCLPPQYVSGPNPGSTMHSRGSETFLSVPVPALAALAVPFNLTEHVEEDKVVLGNLGLCMSLQGQCCVRVATNGL